MKAVLLAGGFGTRLSEETNRIPKPMIEIGGSPILWHIMKIYSHWGVNDFVICLGYKGYIIKEYFANYLLHRSDAVIDIRGGRIEVHNNNAEPWRVTLVDTGADVMTGGRLKRVRAYLDDEPFCMTYGDGLANIDIGRLTEFHRHHGRLATVTAVRPPGRFGVLEINGGEVTGIREKPEASESQINGGFFVLSPAALDTVDGDETSWEREPMQRLAERRQLMPFFHEGFWQPMDTLRERRLLEDLWTTGQAPWKVW